MTDYFLQAFVYLSAAVIMVPIAKRLGLGSVLGYLIAGVIIGPVFGLVGEETNTIQHFAEFGVVMMLFLVGLELEPKMLWAMKNRLIGLGGLQVVLTAASVMAIATWFHQPWSIALAIGLVFSLSSTAIVLQTFGEKGLSKTDGAKNAFSVLLFQDIAVIPMFAFIPLLALPDLITKAQQAMQSASQEHANLSLVAGLPGWSYGLVILSAIAFLVVGGHYASRPLFRFVAKSGLREIFTATALMLVVGIAALMSLVGLSPALGTFLAGVVLANSEFRHELESNIAPFKGLLLGLFFITVGAGINFSIFTSQFFQIVAITLGVMLVKALVLLVLSVIFGIRASDRWLFSLSLAQAGEFGFVLLSFTVQNHVLPAQLAQTLSMVVALSMFLTPGLFIVLDKVILPKFVDSSNNRENDVIEETGSVIIAGMGRFGQVVNRLLISNHVPTVVLDYQSSTIDVLRRLKMKAYYGDATNTDLLQTAGVEDARLFIVAMDNTETSVELVKYLRHTYPHLTILARAFDRRDAYMLREAGANYVVKETFHSALEMGASALKKLGTHPFRAEQQKNAYITTEERASDALYAAWSDNSEGERFDNNYRKLFMQFEDTLKQALHHDKHSSGDQSERSWTPPPKNYQGDDSNHADNSHADDVTGSSDTDSGVQSSDRGPKKHN